MANSTQSSYKKLNGKAIAKINEDNICNSIANQQSVFFNKTGKDGKVHIQIPRYINAATNKQIYPSQAVYIAQQFKNNRKYVVKTSRIITEAGAKALGTSIKTNSPHVEVSYSKKLEVDDIKKREADEENLNKKIAATNDPKEKKELSDKLDYVVDELTSGYSNIPITYYPAYQVQDQRKLANAFLIKNTGFFNQKNFDEFKKENLKENQYRKGPAIDGDSAKDWKEHVKNCLTGREVILSKEKAAELSSSMLNDLSNAHANAANKKEYYLFQDTLKKASYELNQEAAAEKERAVSQSIEQNTPDKENSIEKEEQSNDIEVF